MGTDYEEGVGGEDPDGGHACDGEGLGGPEDEVDEDAEDDGKGSIQPEENEDSFVEPPSNCTEAVLSDID